MSDEEKALVYSTEDLVYIDRSVNNAKIFFCILQTFWQNEAKVCEKKIL